MKIGGKARRNESHDGEDEDDSEARAQLGVTFAYSLGAQPKKAELLGRELTR